MADKRKALFLCTEHESGQAEYGMSWYRAYFGQSLADTDLADVIFSNMEEIWSESGRNEERLGRAIANFARRENIDVIIPQVQLRDGYRLSTQAADIIQSECDATLLLFWWDSASQGNMDIGNRYGGQRLLEFACDALQPMFEQAREPDRWTPMWTPTPRWFAHGDGPRPIDVSFTGKAGTRRTEALNHVERALADHGYTIAFKTNWPRMKLSNYVKFLQQSKIVINFAQCQFRQALASPWQAKGRLFEATCCGAMVMEERNPESARFYDDSHEIVMWDNHRDLVEKLRHYLAMEEYREKVANAGHARWKSCWTAKHFWTRVFDRVARNRARTADAVSAAAA